MTISRACSVAVMLGIGLVPARAAQGRRISLPLPRQPGFAHEDTFAFRASRDGRWVVYLADDGVDDLFELYGVPSDGSAPAHKLNDPLVAGGHLVEVQGDPPFRTYDGPYLRTSDARVAYRADQDTDGVYELFGAPLDGSAPAVKLNGPLVGGGHVSSSFEFAGSGARVVYLADATIDERHELFSSPADGSAPPVRLSAPLTARGGVEHGSPSLLVTPDGETVLFRAIVPPRVSALVYAVPADGSAPPRQVSGPRAVSMALVPDGSGVVYLAEDSLAGSYHELWYAPLAAGSPRLRLDARAGVGDIDAYAIGPDSTRAVYLADHALPGTRELWSVPLDGSALPARLNAPLSSGQDVAIDAFAFATGGARVVYAADQDVPGTLELYAAPADGSTSAVKLSTTPVPGGGLGGSGQWPPFVVGAERAVWLGDLVTDEVFELFSAPLDGSAPAVRLNSPLPEGGDAGGDTTLAFALSADEQHVAFRGDALVDGQHELLLVPTDGSAPPVRLSGELVHLGGVAGEIHPGIDEGFALTSDGTRVLYRADQEIDERFDLWSVALDRPGQPVRLDPPLDPGPPAGAVGRFEWSSSEGRLVYSNGPSVYAITPAAHLEPGPLQHVVLGSGNRIEISPDGSCVTFERVTEYCDEFYCGLTPAELGSRPIDGIAPAALLNPGLPGFAEVVRFTPDGAHVVFYENHTYWRTRARGLFSVPSDGSAAPLSLTEPPGMVSDVLDVGRYRISADGLRVVFEQRYSTERALVSVPLDRSAEPVVLHPPVTDVRSGFELTPDSTRAVFVADVERPGTFELHVAPLDASAPPVRLHPPLAPGHAVDSAFRIAPGGERALIVAELEEPGVFELWSVPLDTARGQPILLLSAKGVPGGDVSTGFPRITGPEAGVPLPQFEPSPDGTRVVYRADHAIDEVFELWSAPLDASAAPVRLHAPLPPDRDVPVFGFRIGADSRRVVFVVEDALRVAHLWSAPLDGSAPARELSGPFVAGGSLWQGPDGVLLSFELSPDGRHVAWLADALADEVFELFLAPADGSRPPRRLNRPLVPGGDVRPLELQPEHAPFAFSPDGRFVAYQADQEGDGVHELFLSAVAVPRARPADRPKQ